MDQLSTRERIAELFRKYRYGILIVLLGIILMCLPSIDKDTTEDTQSAATQNQKDSSLEEALGSILSQIKGAGKVEVLLTEAKGSETMYQSDSLTDSETDRNDTVIISGADRTQTGLIRQVNPPRYLGAIVVCQGADNAQVRLAIVQAVISVTGLGADHITVLKMK
jgi:stage III sporulation protein AG